MIQSDRYVAFLLSTLPKLAARRLYPPWWPLPMRRFAVFGAALREMSRRPGLALEFGVYQGASLRFSARKYPDRIFYGFDSFCGFPPDGRPDWQLDFATDRLPAVLANCRLIPGWFRDTIPEFLRQRDDTIAFVNIDCDIYGSTREVLFGLGDRLRPGTVLYFDELINYDTFLWNEMRALFEFLEATGFDVAWIATHSQVRQLEEVFAYFDAGHYPPWRDDVALGYHRPAAGVLVSGTGELAMLSSSPERERLTALAARFDAWTERYHALRPSAPSL